MISDVRFGAAACPFPAKAGVAQKTSQAAVTTGGEPAIDSRIFPASTYLFSSSPERWYRPRRAFSLSKVLEATFFARIQVGFPLRDIGRVGLPSRLVRYFTLPFLQLGDLRLLHGDLEIRLGVLQPVFGRPSICRRNRCPLLPLPPRSASGARFCLVTSWLRFIPSQMGISTPREKVKGPRC